MDKTSVLKVVVYGATVIVAAALVIAIINPGKIPPPRQFTDEEKAMIPSTESYATPSISKGIERPRNENSDEPRISDDEEVIGVLVDDKARAYRVAAFTGHFDHVVNDMLGGVPVTVTYCDRADFARVFTDDTNEPLDLGTGGWSGEQMWLRLDEENYEHTSTEIPFKDKDFERITWQDWKAKHPDTTVYIAVARDDAGAVKTNESDEPKVDSAESPPGGKPRTEKSSAVDEPNDPK